MLLPAATADTLSRLAACTTHNAPRCSLWAPWGCLAAVALQGWCTPAAGAGRWAPGQTPAGTNHRFSCICLATHWWL